jgi:hypothetical protein
MNEQTKTQIEHSREVKRLKRSIEILCDFINENQNRIDEFEKYANELKIKIKNLSQKND